MKKTRRKDKNRTGAGIIAFVVIILFAIVSYNRIGLAEEINNKHTEISRLDDQIQDQEDRALDIKNKSEYVKSKEYIEEIAREKLGLVYKDEIIFKKDDK